MQRHIWRENTEEGVRFYRASYHAATWVLHSQLQGEEDWSPHDPISNEDWAKLRDVLWRKYQRGRGAWKIIEKIDRLLDPSLPEGVRIEGREDEDPSGSSPSAERTP